MTSRPLPAPAHVKDAIGSCPKVPGEGAGGPTAPLLRRSFPDSANTNPACPVRRELQRHDGELFGDGRVPGSTGARFAAFALGFVLLSFHRSSFTPIPSLPAGWGDEQRGEEQGQAPRPAPRTVWLTPPCGPTACSGPLCGSHLPPPRPPLPSPRTEMLCCLGFQLLNQTALAEHCLSTSPAGGSVLLSPDERPELLPSLLLGCLCDPRGLERGHEESLTLISISVMVTQCESCFVSETSGLNHIRCACLAAVGRPQGAVSGPHAGRRGLGPVVGEGYRAPLSDPLHVTGLFLPRQNPACQS